MSLSSRKFDSSDPRRPELARPYQLPAHWTHAEPDIYSGLLGSASMLSGASLLTRMPQFAYAGFIAAVMHVAHDQPLSRQSKDSTGGPWTGLLFSIMAMITSALPVLLGQPQGPAFFSALKNKGATIVPSEAVQIPMQQPLA